MSQIRNALSPSFVDVNNAVNGGGPFAGPAQDGDTVIVPGGPPVSWTNTLIVVHNISLLGATTTDSSVGTAVDNTVIQDNVFPRKELIRFTTVANDTLARVSGFTFAAGTAAGNSLNGVIYLDGRGHSVRIDHNNFQPELKANEFVGVWGAVWGVADHNIMKTAGTQTFNVNMTDWPYANGDPAVYGDGSWNSPINWGSREFFFAEDNWLENVSIAVKGSWRASGAIDGTWGQRFVFRHNHCINMVLQNHGTEGGRFRGCRVQEFYGNDFHYTRNGNGAIGAINNTGGNRSGITIAHDNTFGGTAGEFKPTAHQNMQAYRIYQFEQSVWGGASGKNAWDSNDVSSGPQTFENGVGSFNYNPTNGVYATGTISIAVNTPPSGGFINLKSTLTDPNHTIAWATNQWANFEIIKTGGTSPGIGNISQIGSNTAGAAGQSSTITTINGSSPRPEDSCNWTAGDTYEIRRPLIVMDQPGRGKSDRISGVSAINENQSNQSVYPRNLLEPSYSWDNFWLGVPGNVQHIEVDMIQAHSTNFMLQKQDRDFYLRTVMPGYSAYAYPHVLVSGVATPSITSANNITFTEGVGGTFQVTSSGFTSTPTYSKSGAFPSSGSTFSSGGLLTVGAGSAAGSYTFTITAINGSETTSQNFTLLITATPTKIIALSGNLGFGNVDINTTAQLTFTITNNGNTILTVTGVTVPTGYSADWTSGTIVPGASHLVTVTFSPIAATAYNGTVTVASDKTSGTNTIAVTGLGAARVMALSGNLAFGSVTTGQTATRQLTVTNNGNVAMNIAAIAYPQGFSGDFTSGVVLAGASKIVNVTFSPLAAQAYSGNVDIQSNKTSGTSTIAISGTGVATATKIIQLTGDLAFGSVQTGGSVTRVLTLTNSGNALLTVSGVSFPTGFSGDWSSGTIAAGASQNINVTFSPVSAISYSGPVTVTSDATGGSNTITASGTGVAPATKIIGLSGNLGFGNVLIGTSPTRTLVIANTGSTPLTVTGITYPSGFSGAFSGTIAPGASQNVTVTFSPSSVQIYDGTITVASDATSGTGTIAVTGRGVAPTTRVISLSGNLSFGNVQKNHTAQRILAITNNGTAALSVSNITLPAGFTANWTSGSIPAGTTQNVTVTFAPLAAQLYSGNVTVVSNKTSGANTMACSGTGRDKKQVPFFLIVG